MRQDESEIVMLPGTGFSFRQGLLMGYPMNDTSFTSGEFLEVSKQYPIRQYQSGEFQEVSKQFTIRQYQSGAVQKFVFPQANATTPLNRGTPNGVSTWGYLLRILSIFIYRFN